MKFKTLLLALVVCCVCTAAQAQTMQRICTPQGCYYVRSTETVEKSSTVDIVPKVEKTVETQTVTYKSQTATFTRRPMPRLRFWW